MNIWEEINERLIKLEVKFDEWRNNHDKHHQRVILPFLIAIVLLLISLRVRR